MENIKFYLHPNVITKKRPSSEILWWIIIHIVFLLFLIGLSACYKIEKKIHYQGSYQGNSIRVLVDKRFFELLTDKVRLKGKAYQYQVCKVEIVAYEEGKASLWEVQISLDLQEEWKIENNQFQLSFVKEETTILKQILKNIKKGMRL